MDNSGGGWRYDPSFSLCGERKTGPNVLASKLGEIRENLILGHSTGEVAENVSDGDTRALYAGLSEANRRIGNDAIRGTHESSINQRISSVKERTWKEAKRASAAENRPTH